MARNKIPKSDFDFEEDIEECGFTDEVSKGKCISSFSFEDESSNINTSNSILVTNSTPVLKKEFIENKSNPDTHSINKHIDVTSPNNLSSINTKPTNTTSLYDNRRTPIANGAAPAIDGEVPAIRRCYVLRASTIRKLNELKSIHPDINICVSTLVDIAIDFYHDNVINKGGIQ